MRNGKVGKKEKLHLSNHTQFQTILLHKVILGICNPLVNTWILIFTSHVVNFEGDSWTHVRNDDIGVVFQLLENNTHIVNLLNFTKKSSGKLP